MWAYHPDLLARPVPRYTSYPTAAEFHDRVGPGDLGAALDALAPGTPASLYLHIPYCHEICWYCGCNTGAANKAQRLSFYLDALEAEVELVARRLAGRARIGRIAFGGGSPNAIAPGSFLQLLDLVRDRFGAQAAELSVELDPRSLSAGWIAAVAAAGATRASLGVQTLADHVQRAIGRVQPADTIARAVAGLRRAGVASLNFDLMYGLPGQSLDDLAATIAASVAMRPDRIALFGYAHVPRMIARQRRIDERLLPGPEQRFRAAELGHRLLVEAGYQPVGFDHFALPHDPLAVAARAGRLRRNFQGFTDDPAETLIGLGASAIGEFPDRLLQNEKNAGRYRMLVSGGALPVARGLLRGGEDRLRARLIADLLCRGEADLGGLPDRVAALERLAPFERRGLVARDGMAVRLRPGALPYARSIAACLDAYRDPAAERFSHAV